MSAPRPVRSPARLPSSVALPATAGSDVAETADVDPIPTARAGRPPAAAVPPTSKEWPS
jgi:hypothetical protein